MRIVDFSPSHAEEAARLHIDGQPGTFLSSLGPEVLTVLYRVLPQSSAGFGYAMMGSPAGEAPADEAPADEAPVGEAIVGEGLAGFVSATTGVGSLFVDVLTRRLGQFLPALARCYARHPRLIWRSAQTLAYPLLVGHGADGAHSTAELLSIMVKPSLRSHGIGALLVNALVAECTARRIDLLDVTVDAQNQGARRFYERHQFQMLRAFALYGRTMCIYQRTLAQHDGQSGRQPTEH